METYEYTWKIGVELATERSLEIHAPIVADNCLADLYSGHRFLVQTVFKAKAIDKAYPNMPDTAIQTWPIADLTADELRELRERWKYTPNETDRPSACVVIL